MIGLEGFFNFLLATCYRAKKEEIVEQRKILESDFEIAKNEAFINIIMLMDNFFSEKHNIDIKNNEEDEWEDKHGNEPTSDAWIRSRQSFCI